MVSGRHTSYLSILAFHPSECLALVRYPDTSRTRGHHSLLCCRKMEITASGTSANFKLVSALYKKAQRSSLHDVKCTHTAMTDDNGPWKLCLIVLNHILWSAQPIAARYLQVYATPLLFDGQGVLATAKFTSAVLVFSSSRIFASVEDSKDSQPLPHDNITQQQQQSLRRTKYLFALLYGTVATCRAALNIESTKFTQSYFTSECYKSLEPLLKQTPCSIQNLSSSFDYY